MTAVHDIVVIGASLGGLEALCRLASLLPARFPAAVLIVLHTHQTSPRMLAKIVGQHSLLPVSYGGEGDAVQQGCIYFAPPDRHMIVMPAGLLSLDAGPKVHYTRPAADRLFQSAAKVYGPRVIGVVLTGGDHDGADGLLAVKAAGGMGIVQEPAEAKVPGMPISALSRTNPDYCVPLDEIAALLVRLVKG